MVVQIKEYTSAQAIAEGLDKELSETKSLLGEYLRKLDEIRTLAEKSKKIREVVLKLAGKKPTTENPSEITVGTLNIILDANPFHELTAIEAPEADSTALQNIINEFKNISPEITNTFIFKRNREILAISETTTEDQIKK